MNIKNEILQTTDKDTIIALCTPRGSGAIALLRLSGENVSEIVDNISRLSSGKKLKDSKTHTIHHGYLISQKNPTKVIDEVLFFLMYAPKSFTGQNSIEISCHNNPFIIEQIIEQAIIAGARLAERGEFTKRAFLNKKIDLTQAESINEIINAQTELALKKSMSKLHGSLSNYLSELEHDFVGLLSLTESSFEFLEEEQKDLDIENLIKEKIKQVSEKLRQAKLNFSQQQQIKDGIRICLLGSVNTGKSTLFNAFLKKDRSIVTKIAGTTRDSIEASIYRNGNFWLFVDTAGLRKTDNFIEQEGIKRSLRQADGADIVLLVFDLSKVLNKYQQDGYKELFEKHREKIVLVANKLDIQVDKSLNGFDFINKENNIKVSAVKKEGIDLLENEIEKRIQMIFSKLQSPFLLNQRQYNLILELEKKLEFVEKNYINPVQYELVAYHIKDLLKKLSCLTGKNVTEKVLDRVFSDFCVGK